MDEKAIQQNEEALGHLLQTADKEFVSRMGVMALAILSEHLTPDQYDEFLKECADNVSELQKHQQLGTIPGQQPQEDVTAKPEPKRANKI